MSHPYLPLTPAERQRMLSYLGIRDVEELLAPLPAKARLQGELPLAAGKSEAELYEHFQELAGMNADLTEYPCFLGAGIYQHHIPAVVRHLSGRAEFYTAYTPYQPEMSQGMLQAIFEFQTLIAELCGLPVANASLYDGATALAEAVLMAAAATGRRKVLVPRTLHPEFRAVLRTYTRYRQLELVELPVGQGRMNPGELPLDGTVAALVAGYPNFFGQIEELAPLAAAVHGAGGLLIAAANPMALGLLASPGELGADLAAGEGQPLGLAPSFGGPGLGFLACREEFTRRLPGRLVGQTTDAKGRRGFVLTLQTREQHIRREKATSNICSNAALGALQASIYLSALGPAGLRETAAQCAAAAHHALARIIADGGYRPLFAGPFFHEFAVLTPRPAAEINAALWRQGIIGGYDLSRDYPELDQALLLAVTELRTAAEIERLVETLSDLVIKE